MSEGRNIDCLCSNADSAPVCCGEERTEAKDIALFFCHHSNSHLFSQTVSDLNNEIKDTNS